MINTDFKELLNISNELTEAIAWARSEGWGVRPGVLVDFDNRRKRCNPLGAWALKCTHNVRWHPFDAEKVLCEVMKKMTHVQFHSIWLGYDNYTPEEGELITWEDEEMNQHAEPVDENYYSLGAALRRISGVS